MHKLEIMNKSRAPHKKLKSQVRNWLPNQHGAWFIVIVPALFGASLGGWVWQHALLLAVWIIGFFFVFSALRWVKNPRRKTLRTPVVVYGVVVGVLGVATLVALPLLAWWIPVFAVIIGIWVEEVWRGRERELGARLSVIVAAGLMTLVAYHCGLMGTALRMGQDAVSGIHEAPVLGGHAFSSSLRGWPAAGMVAGELVAYFAASVPYVKTIFRRRGGPPIFGGFSGFSRGMPGGGGDICAVALGFSLGCGGVAGGAGACGMVPLAGSSTWKTVEAPRDWV